MNKSPKGSPLNCVFKLIIASQCQLARSMKYTLTGSIDRIMGRWILYNACHFRF